MADGYIHDSYGTYRSGSERSAAIVAGLLAPLLGPSSVLDVGCGTGGWLEAFRKAGVGTVHGVDGPWSPAGGNLQAGEFTRFDFETAEGEPSLPQPRYDLVISMEFVEHVAAARADKLARFLASKGDVLLVSAAIPLQGGQHHVNERWPEYWGRKFEALGFAPFDAIRLALWDETGVESWYRQNMILYFRGEVPGKVRAWGEKLAIEALGRPRALVHPEFYAKRFGRQHLALTNPLRFLRTLLAERKSGERAIPAIGNLPRE
ncbi:MAG: class I SAM-dependent methyltransferase [Pseudomonadota bacterium]